MKTVKNFASLAVVALAAPLLLVAGAPQVSASPCATRSGFVCLYQDNDDWSPQFNTTGNISYYPDEYYFGGGRTIDDSVSRVSNRSAGNDYHVSLYYHPSYQGYYGCVNPGSTWNLPGGVWPQHAGDNQNPNDNTSSHHWYSGKASYCAA